MKSKLFLATLLVSMLLCPSCEALKSESEVAEGETNEVTVPNGDEGEVNQEINSDAPPVVPVPDEEGPNPFKPAN